MARTMDLCFLALVWALSGRHPLWLCCVKPCSLLERRNRCVQRVTECCTSCCREDDRVLRAALPAADSHDYMYDPEYLQYLDWPDIGHSNPRLHGTAAPRRSPPPSTPAQLCLMNLFIYLCATGAAMVLLFSTFLDISGKGEHPQWKEWLTVEYGDPQLQRSPNTTAQDLLLEKRLAVFLDVYNFQVAATALSVLVMSSLACSRNSKSNTLKNCTRDSRLCPCLACAKGLISCVRGCQQGWDNYKSRSNARRLERTRRLQQQRAEDDIGFLPVGEAVFVQS
jgi:hypothetical protein